MAKAGEDVLFVDTNRDHVLAIRRNGIRVDGVYGPMSIGPQRASTPGELTEPLKGLIFLACKSQATESAVRGLIPHLSTDACIVSLQNGFNEPLIGQLVGMDRVVGALPDYGAAYLEPGFLEAVNEGPVYVGELDGRSSARATEAYRLLGLGPNRSILSGDIVGRLWTKQVYFSQILVESLVDGPIWEVLGDRRVQLVSGAVVREAIAVADTAGVRLQSDDLFDPASFRITTVDDTRRLLEQYDRVVSHLASHQSGGLSPTGYRYVKTGSGVQWDILYRKRKSEAAHLSICRQARELNVPVPLNERLLSMIDEIEESHRLVGWHNIDELGTFASSFRLALPER